MEKLLTISIAAYNVEKYIESTLDSLVIHASYMDMMEVLIINDGSNDGTSSIAHRYEEKYPGIIRVIDKDNGGYGSTINTSIREAKGKYYKLVDGDDWVDQQGLMRLLDCLKDLDADAVVTKYITVENETKTKVEKDVGLLLDNQVHEFDDLEFQEAIPMHMLTFKTCILANNHISITENCFYTDVEYLLKPIPYIHTLFLLDVSVYMYRIGRAEQSVSINSWRKNIDQALIVTFSLINYYNNLDKVGLSAKKRNYILSRIIGTAKNKYHIFLSFEKSIKIKKKVREYDRNLRKISVEIYRACGTDKLVRLLRIPGMPLYGILSSIYRKHLKDKGLEG